MMVMVSGCTSFFADDEGFLEGAFYTQDLEYDSELEGYEINEDARTGGFAINYGETSNSSSFSIETNNDYEDYSFHYWRMLNISGENPTEIVDNGERVDGFRISFYNADEANFPYVTVDYSVGENQWQYMESIKFFDIIPEGNYMLEVSFSDELNFTITDGDITSSVVYEMESADFDSIYMSMSRESFSGDEETGIWGQYLLLTSLEVN